MRRWADLRTRAATAALLAPVALGCVWAGAEWWAVFMAVAGAGLAWEWVRLCGGRLRSLPGTVLPVTVFLAAVPAFLGWPFIAFALLAGGAILGWALADQAHGPVDPSWLSFGVIYIGVAGVALILLREDDRVGRDNVIFLFLVVWASDIGAYLAGRWLGGPKLFPAISPNKTWSGALGGLVGAVAAGVTFAHMVSAAPSIGSVVAVAALLGIAAQSGDLLESWIKRQFGVKDSSGLIPGHGGLLDRLDGVMAAAPVGALIGALLGPGAHLWR